MKEMIKRVREEKGGFTLAELLIVVAIVLVLVAIAVPVFTGALGKANDAVESANQRSVRMEAAALYLVATTDDEYKALPATFYISDSGNVTTTAPTSGKYKSYGVTYPPQPSTSSNNINNVNITVATGVDVDAGSGN